VASTGPLATTTRRPFACFEKAVAADPNCAMAHWGIGYAAGPNLQLSLGMDGSSQQGPRPLGPPRHDAARRPAARIGRRQPPQRKRALIEALAHPLPAARHHRRPEPLERRLRRRHCAAHIRRIPATLEISHIFAEAILNRTALAHVGSPHRRAPCKVLVRWRAREVLESAFPRPAWRDEPSRPAAPPRPPHGDVAASRGRAGHQ